MPVQPTVTCRGIRCRQQTDRGQGNAPRTGQGTVAQRVHVHEYTVEGDELVPINNVRAPASYIIDPGFLKALIVKNVDLQIQLNTKAHHTDEFEITHPLADSGSEPREPVLVVRRGQLFSVAIEFSRPYDENKDDLKLVFEAGDKPLASNDTYVEFILSDDDLPNQWGAKIVSTEGCTSTINIFTQPTCPVAKWTFKIDVLRKQNTGVEVYRYIHKTPIYILFNPWCKDDLVYMQEEKLLDEYILNESGILFTNEAYNIATRPWFFGQFDSIVLELAIDLLDKSTLSWSSRGDPVKIVRTLSAVLNSEEDKGVLTGKWDGNYSDGIHPFDWTGSVKVLEQYWNTKSPVKYGQCWVFAGLTTTIGRALGIPTRPVTNFDSGRDKDGNMTIDVFVENAAASDDFIWNFHVWAELWMARPDLPQGYGGWQAMDSTAQELSKSSGMHQCGPASVVAIKQGDAQLIYDTGFMFDEVNGDEFQWTRDDFGNYKFLGFLTNSVGKFISTKAPNSDERLDITSSYKYTEGTFEERAAVRKATSLGPRNMYKPLATDVSFVLKHDPKKDSIGETFKISLKMKNTSQEHRTVGGRIVISSMLYTGVLCDQLKSETFNIALGPEEEKSQKVQITQEEYDGQLKDGYFLDVSVLVRVDKTEQIFTKKENYKLRTPELNVKAPSKAVVNQEFSVQVSFINPLKRTLTGCAVILDGVGSAVTIPQRNVPANGQFEATLWVHPKRAGQKQMILKFTSKQLQDINASFPIRILEG